MTVISPSFDLSAVEWRRIQGDDPAGNKVDIEVSLLGYDFDSGRLDMLLRYAPGGYCRRHRHVASTVTLVLDGEQFLEEYEADGTSRTVHRKKGDYALSPADAHIHDEWGGPEGGTVLLSMTAPEGVLFEYFGASTSDSWTLSIKEYVDAWEAGDTYGRAPTGS